jgi:hypothetical protein
METGAMRAADTVIKIKVETMRILSIGATGFIGKPLSIT